jgi:hypothetical protein
LAKEYKAVMLVTLEVHEVDSKGQCTGKPLTSVELEKYGLKSKVLLTTKKQHKTGLLKKLAQCWRSLTSD